MRFVVDQGDAAGAGKTALPLTEVNEEKSKKDWMQDRPFASKKCNLLIDTEHKKHKQVR